MRDDIHQEETFKKTRKRTRISTEIFHIQLVLKKRISAPCPHTLKLRVSSRQTYTSDQGYGRAGLN